MGVAAYISKLTGGPININTINKTVEKMLTEALQASEVESVYDHNFKTEDIFSDVFLKQLDEMHAPSTKFELLSKLLERKIDEYAKVNKVQAKKFSEMLEDVIDAYNTRDKFTFANEVAGQTIDSVNALVEEKVKSLTERLLEIFRGLNKDKEEFRALGITFEEKAFFDILVDIRNRNGFEYPDERCISLAKKIKELVDGTAIYADFLNNNNLRNQMASEIAYLIYKEGYPPQWDDEVFRRVLDQVQNYKKYN
jgi:type I restriction enzyme R subunit